MTTALPSGKVCGDVEASAGSLDGGHERIRIIKHAKPDVRFGYALS